MLKHLAIFAMLLVAISVPGQSSKDTGPNHDPGQQQQPAVHPADGKQSRANAEGNQGKPDNNSPTGNASVEGSHWWAKSDWWLVVIAGCTGLVIGWQSWETRKAAQGAKEGAEIARKSIDMTVLKERANVRIEIGELEVGQFNDRKWRARVVILISNFGETKAFPTSASAAMLLSPTGERQPKDYAGALVNVSAIFPTTEKPLKAPLWIMDGMDEESIWKLNTENAYIHLSGYIDYDDVFGGKHRTTFRYVWKADGWMEPAGDGEPDLSKTLCGGWEQAGSESDNEAY